MCFSRVKPMMNSEEMCGGLTGYTRQRLLMFQTLSADDEMSIRELSRFSYRALQRRNDIATLQSST